MQRLVGLLLLAIVAFCTPAAAQFNGCAPGICNTNPQTTNFPLPGIVSNGYDCYYARGLYYPSNAGCAPTVVRASTGTAFDANGNLLSFGNNVPRITSLGLLIEESRTNLLLWSQAPGGNPGSWANSGATPPTVTDNATTSPDGTADASLWTRNIASSSFTAQIITKAASSLPYTYSTCVKTNQSRYAALRLQGVFPNRVDVTFDMQTGVISAAATASGTFTSASATMSAVVAQGFYCFTVTAVTDAATSLTAIFSCNGNGGPVDVTSALPQSCFWFSNQLEQAGSALSYIVTTSAAVTRAADAASVAVTGVGAASTVYGAGTPVVPVGTSEQVANLNDTTAANSIAVLRNAAGAGQGAVTAATVSQYNQTVGTWNQNALGKAIVSAVAGTQNAAFDGTAMTAGTGASQPTGLNTVRLGGNAAGTAAFFNGYLTRWALWPTVALPSATQQALTTVGQFN